MLLGNALTDFERDNGTYVLQTTSQFKQSLDDITVHVFPSKSYKRKKRYMQNGLEKPRDTPIKSWVGSILELNRYFREFPRVNGLTPDMLDDRKILKILEVDIPKLCQKKMTIQGFKLLLEGMKKFVDS